MTIFNNGIRLLGPLYPGPGGGFRRLERRMDAIQMASDLPFVYVGSLRRTGSTVVAEALTKLPYAFIFREPGLGDNRFSLKQIEIDQVKELGVDLAAFRSKQKLGGIFKKRIAGDQAFMLHAFKKQVVPEMLEKLQQVGVKEIRHDNWRNYIETFPEMKVVLTSRDPRDIYISLHGRFKKGTSTWQGEFTPERVAKDLNFQFSKQLEMIEAADCLRIRYEDLCLQADAKIDEIRKFTKSPIPTIGDVGAFNATNPDRVDEYQLHGGEITDKRVARWRSEEDAELRAEAQKAFDLMEEYAAFWGYERE